MFSIVRKFFSTSHEQIDDELQQSIDNAIDITINGTDPRLAQIRGYKKKLKNSVKIALRHIDKIVEDMHPPLEINRRQYAADPQVHAFFGSASDIEDIFRRDRGIKEFLYRSVSNNEFLYLGMAMRMSTKNVLARKLVRGIEKKDVKRTAVNFSEHRLVEPCDSEQDLRSKIKERVFMTLIQACLIRLVSIKDQKHELEEQRSLLKAKLRNYKNQALGLEPVSRSSVDDKISFEGLKSELTEIESALKHISTNIVTLDQYLDVINEVMEHPTNYLKAENSSIRVTRMNFTTSLKEEDPGNDIVFTDFQANENNVVGRLAKISRNELK